ncbi:importin-9-like [Ruditapes philippinarum]|uniref:importin-9-like n=1 Tax=Ruditapes philippinarum TaxID=129788 RepID=UPI00295A9916|nr:importin-9-like [Ruditapes philippinarum]
MAGVTLPGHNQTLKEALIESLTAILSPDHKTRINGEEQVKALEVTEEFGVHLAELTVDPNGPLAIRQLASVLLKQYVEVHWCIHSEKFRAPETPTASKEQIRKILPVGLKEAISKVRSSVAYAVSAIAHWDWPEAWPDLFQILMQALTSGDTNAVHGAMRVLAEFTQDVTDTQMVHVAPVILPEMYKIFLQHEVFSIRTRSRAVNIFNICAGMIATMSELQKGLAKQLLFPVIPQFTQAFVEALLVPDGPSSDSGLKMEIMKAITTLVKSFPKLMSQWIGQILQPVWSIFTLSSDFYVRTVVNNTEDADDPVDSDGGVLGFENLVYGVFEFIHALLDSSKFRDLVKKSINDILYYVITYMQITEDQGRLWMTNPDQFVEDEDDDTFSYSVRISAQDLLMLIGQEFEDESALGLCQAITKHLQEAEAQKSVTDNWWKIHESCMFALGTVRSLVIDTVKSGRVQFDISAFLENVVLTDLNLSVSPFLIGRCLWTASRYCEGMNTELLQRCLQATVGGIHPTQPPVIRISAIRAVYGYCDFLKTSENTQLLVPFLPNITEGLVNVATQFSSDVLSLCLETLSIVLSVDKAFTASCESKVTPLTIAVFLKYSSDPVVTSIVQEIFKELALNDSCMGPLQHRLLPTIVSILQASPDKVAVGLPSVALDMLETIVRSSKVPISDELMSAFPAAAHCTLNTDDNSTMQSGGECVRAYASVALDQVAQWHDEQGNSGLTYIIQVISKLLDPKTSEYTASFVGRLVTVVLIKVGHQLGEKMDLILRAVLSKMQQTETLSVMQSLLVIFARLMYDQMEAVLEFLTSVPDPMGKPALEFVLKEWCARQHLFYGAYERKVMVVALSKLLQHTITNNDARLKDIMVDGDEVITSTSNGPRTRSKSQVQWTTIPVVVKIYKLLINELSNQIEQSMSTRKGEDPEEEDEGWEDDDDDDCGDLQLSGQTLSSLLDDFSNEFSTLIDDAEDEEDDPDALSDPVNQLDLQAYLTEFLQSLSQQPYYSMFTSHHTDSEKQVLHKISIAV